MKTRFLFLISLLPQLLLGANIYVSPNGDSNASGTNWNNTTSLHNALNIAAPDDSIFLTEGTYTPSQRVTNGRTEKENCFEIKQNITLMGGFSTSNFSYNPQLFPTILSGTINETTSVYHTIVITAPTHTITLPTQNQQRVSLIGLTIQGALANNTRRTTINGYIYPQNYGAGIIMVNGNLYLSQCTFNNNSAAIGGAIYANNCAITSENCSFELNTATESGGALHLTEALFSLNTCQLTNNAASIQGDNITATLSKGIINNTQISSNGTNQALLIDSTTCYTYNSALINNDPTENSLIETKNGAQLYFINSTAAAAASNTNILLLNGGKTYLISSSLVGGNSVSSTNNNKLILFNTLAGSINTAQEIIQSIANQNFYNTLGNASPITDTNNLTLPLSRDNSFTTFAPLNETPSNPAISKAIALNEWLKIGSKHAIPGFALTLDQRFQHRDTNAIAIGCHQPTTLTHTSPNKLWHLLIYGQSLAEGYQSYPPISNFSLENNFMFGHNVCSNNGNKNLDKLSPLFSTPTPSDIEEGYAKQIANASKCENAITGMANHLRTIDPNLPPIIATSCATGGRTIEQLSKHCQRGPFYYRDFLNAIEMGTTAAKNQNTTIEMPAIVWMQGESNYIPNYPGLITATDNTTDKNQYKALMVKLKNDMQEDACSKYNQAQKPLFITYQVGGKYIRGEEQAIAMAQLEAANEYDDIICAGPVYAMTDYAAGHLDANGYRWYGEMLAKVFLQTTTQNQPFKPLQPTKITRLNDYSIEIQFYVPVPPLAFDTLTLAKEPNYGFVLTDNNGLKTINSISCNNTAVTITCAQPISGNLTIGYAGPTTLGHGNLRDSDTYKAKFNYINLDEKLNDGSFKYDRVNNGSLHPRYEPRDNNGIIYNKPYPLYNFSLHYCYTLPIGSNAIDLINQSVNTQPATKPQNIALVNNNLLTITGAWEKAHIYAINGIKLQSYTYTNTIDVSSLNNGVYLCLIEANNSMSTLTFIK